MIDRKFKHIDKVVWETSKCTLNSLEVESDDLDLKFFYTPLKSPLQPISTKLESCMSEDHGKRHSKILLDAHETIIARVVITGCAYQCPLKTTRKSLEKTLCTKMSFNNVNGCERLRVSIKRVLPHLLISNFDRSRFIICFRFNLRLYIPNSFLYFHLEVKF